MAKISTYTSSILLWILIILGITHYPIIGIIFGVSTLWLAYIIRKETNHG